MTMKYCLAILIAFVVLVKIAEITPITKAPTLSVQPRLQASLLQAPEASFHSESPTEGSSTPALLELLESVIDRDRDMVKGLELIEQSTSSEVQESLLELYKAKILARGLEFEEAERLLSLVNNPEMAILKAAVLIALDDRDRTGAYLHDLAENHQDPHIKSQALSLLQVYYAFDRHRDTDKSYLWTLFAQKLGDLEEYEIALYLAEKAIEQNPEYRDAWTIKGYLEFTLKRYDAAIVSLLKAYSLDPGNPHLQYLLGLTYFELHEAKESTQYLLYAQQNLSALMGEHAATTIPYQEIILEKLGENALMADDRPLALHYFSELLKLNPGHAAANKHLQDLSQTP